MILKSRFMKSDHSVNFKLTFLKRVLGFYIFPETFFSLLPGYRFQPSEVLLSYFSSEVFSDFLEGAFSEEPLSGSLEVCSSGSMPSCFFTI